MASSAKFARIESKLEKYIDEGKLYEAEQLYSTLVSRYASVSLWTDGIRLAASGSIRLLSGSSHSEGIKLANQIIDLLNRGNVQALPEHIELVLKVNASFTADAANAKITFLKNAIKWSIEHGATHRTGSPELHLALAEFYEGQKQFGNASWHFLKAYKYREHVQFMVKWIHQGSDSEHDLFIARVILQYLCLENIEGANFMLGAFMSKSEEFHVDSPLINFIRFVLQAIIRKSIPLYQMLRSKYEPSIRRDPVFFEYLDHIGSAYFAITPVNTSGFSGLFSELFSQ